MADSFGPFDNANMGEAGWKLIFDRLSGVMDGLVATVSGVTARGVDLSPGTVLHQGFHYTTDTVKSVASNTNTSGSPRIDRVVTRLDLSANTNLPTVLQGTPAANPLPPSISDMDEPLWRWRVENGATAVSQLVDERTFIGEGVTSGARPDTATTSVRDGHVHFEAGTWIGWDGSSWVTLYEDTGWVNATLEGAWFHTSEPLRVKRVGKIVNLTGTFERGDFSLVAQPHFGRLGTIPTGFAPPQRVHNHCDVAGTDVRSFAMRVNPSGILEIDLDGKTLNARSDIDCNMTWLVD